MVGSGRGAVGRAVTSNTKGPGFKSGHQQFLLNIFTDNCLQKRRKEKTHMDN